NALTSFRFIAALFVFIHHVGLWSQYKTGYLGVSFFFILSGFILAFNYNNKLLKLDSIEIRKFYIARLSKIYPIHVITFFLAIPYYFFIPLQHKPILYIFQGFSNLFLIHSFIPFGNISYNGVSWSLSDEGLFYILFPYLLFLVLKYFSSISRMIFIISCLWIIFVLSFWFYLPLNNELSEWFAYFFPGTRVFEFFVGIILGLIFIRLEDWFRNFSFLFFSLFEIGSILLLFLVVVLSLDINQNLRYGLVYIPFWSFIIYIFAFQKGVISKILTNY
ncbi:acyltransferase family protein, partial [Neobacillus vireti]|uniref:acyltransferase family protein n=1 Tax=Neobacillus vireti TaxID=220686 RepID=UPI002FFDE81D